MTRLRLSLAALFLVGSFPAASQPPQKAVIGYIYSRNRPLAASDVSAEKLTHINYAFANIKDGLMVEGSPSDPENFNTLNTLKKRNPALKILISVGGWTWSGGFSDMALTPESRKRFIDSAVAFLERYRLDGLDIDWEYPGQKGLNNTNRPEDKTNCTALLAETRVALDKAAKAGQSAGKHFLLTMATGANDSWIEHTEMDKAQASLDFVNLMTYDMAGDWDPVTAHHSPLFTNPASPKGQSCARSVDLFIAAGVPAGKIVLGTPFYGKAWGDVPPQDNGLHQPGKRVAARLGTNFKDIKANLEGKDGFVRYWDDISKAPFLYNAAKRIFISYEDEQSIGLKGGYVKERGLAGIMFWEYNGDSEGKLLDAIDLALRQ
jgi:chitinase